jgi:long-chain acyl-CoA synthetase
MRSLIENLACRTPADSVIESAGRNMSAADVADSVKRLCAFLQGEEIKRVALLAGNSADWIIADLACQAANICLLPLPVFFADTQLLHSLESVGVDAILTDDPQRCLKLPPCAGVETGAVPGSELTLVRVLVEDIQPLPEGTQKITFTSGSTGAPRGVCLAVAQQLRVAAALQDVLQLQAPRHLCLLPLSTLLENVGGIYWPLLANGTVIVPPETETGFSGSTGLDLPRLIEALERHRPTSIILVPQMLVGLVSYLEAGWSPPEELRFAAVGGARVDADLLRRARQLGFPVYEGYGLSETGSVCCLNRPGDEHIGSVGRPLPHAALSIENGEIFVSGNTFLGYVGDVSSWGKPHVATGDLGRLDANGYIYVEGRRKNLLISSFGRNISPEWIESQLLAHPLIAQCVVLGDGRPYCSALIVPRDATADRSSIQTLLERVNRQLPDYARIQRWHYLPAGFDRSSDLFTENGKPRRAAIAQQFATVIEALYAVAPGVNVA